MDFLRDTWYLFGRLVQSSIRMPIFLIISVVQPALWVVLFGQLFRSVATIPGFENDSYIQFPAPGIAIMTSLYSSSYSGMSLLGDIDRGVLDRMLATPASRAALMVSRLLYSAAQVILHATIILVVAVLLGARAKGGLLGLLVVLLAAALLSVALSAFSNALGLLTRRQELILAISNFTLLPMIFSSSMLMSQHLMPGWLGVVARFNPINWAVSSARSGFEGQVGSPTLVSLLLLAAFAGVLTLFATRAFRRYLKSL